MEQSLVIKRNFPISEYRALIKRPEVVGILTPVERAILLSASDKTIAEYTGSELSYELRDTLQWIAKDIGYRVSDQGDWQYLVVRTAEILKRYYPGLTLKDFRMAFEMSITGELDDFLPKGRDGQPDRNHYQQFNADYICKILNAYKQRRSGVLRKAREAVPQPEPGRDYESERKYHKMACEDLLNVAEYYRQFRKLPEISPIAEMLYYNILAGVGIAPKIEITEQEQRYAFQQALGYYSRKGLIGDMNRLKSEGITSEELKHDAFRISRRKALAEALEKVCQEGINLSELIYGED